MARHATLVEHDDDDLVIVDLDQAPLLYTQYDREAFDEQFAELAFGLGTVRRRVHTDRASRAPLWVLLLAVIAMLAVLAGNGSSSTTSEPDAGAARVLDAPTGATLQVVADDELGAIDVDRRTLQVTPHAGGPEGAVTAAVSTGNGVAAIIGDHAYAFARSGSAGVTDLGRADVLFGAEPGSVWLGLATDRGWQVRRVETSQGKAGTANIVDFRPGAGRPVGVLPIDGVALDQIRDGHRVVATNGSARALHRGDAVLGMAGTSLVVLDCRARTCTTVFLDLDAPGERRIGTPLPSGWSIGASAVARSGGTVAALASPPGSDTSRVLVVSPGIVRLVDVGGHATGLAWDRDWLFVTLDDGRLMAIGPAGPAKTVDISPLPAGTVIVG